MSETRVGEAKPDGAARTRKVTRNRKNYGTIVHYPGPDRVSIYWTQRRTDQFHQKEKSWLVEADTISAVRLYGVTHVGLLIEDGTKLLVRIDAFGPEGLEKGVQRKLSAEYIDPWGRRGAMCWYVPDAMWSRAQPGDDERREAILRQMHVKRSRARAKSVLTESR